MSPCMRMAIIQTDVTMANLLLPSFAESDGREQRGNVAFVRVQDAKKPSGTKN